MENGCGEGRPHSPIHFAVYPLDSATGASSPSSVRSLPPSAYDIFVNRLSATSLPPRFPALPLLQLGLFVSPLKHNTSDTPKMIAVLQRAKGKPSRFPSCSQFSKRLAFQATNAQVCEQPFSSMFHGIHGGFKIPSRAFPPPRFTLNPAPRALATETRQGNALTPWIYAFSSPPPQIRRPPTERSSPRSHRRHLARRVRCTSPTTNDGKDAGCELDQVSTTFVKAEGDCSGHSHRAALWTPPTSILGPCPREGEGDRECQEGFLDQEGEPEPFGE